jgi:hypothetical protein
MMELVAPLKNVTRSPTKAGYQFGWLLLPPAEAGGCFQFYRLRPVS